MRNRQPAEQRMDPYVSRTAGTLARSPVRAAGADAPAGQAAARRKDDREPRRSSPSCASSTACLTFVLLLMLLVGGAAYVFDSQIDAPGPLEQAKTVVIPKGEGTQEIACAARARGHHHRSPPVHRRLSVDQVRRPGSTAPSRCSSRPATTR